MQDIPDCNNIWFCFYFEFIEWDDVKDCWTSPINKKTRAEKLLHIEFMDMDNDDSKLSLDDWIFLHSCEQDDIVKRTIWKVIKKQKKHH